MAHCGRFIEPAVSRREMLRTAAGGFGALALAALAAEPSYGAIANAAAVKENPHGHGQLQFEPKARNVIFLYMDGGPSHVDTFDPKPRLANENGQPFKMKIEATQFNNNGNTLASPWKFNRRGESGIPVSDLFPCVGRLADELTIVRSMVSEFSVHTSANYFLHSGNGQQGRPSMGAWITYGLGSECDNLPGFVVLNGGLIPVGGLDNFTNGFLPATYQASILKPDGQAIANIRPLEARAELQQNKLALLRKLDRHALDRQGSSDPLESAIANYELAFRMQTAVPELLDLSRESEATRRLYGLDSRFAPTRTFAMECLLARRLVERGVRFVELDLPDGAWQRSLGPAWLAQAWARDERLGGRSADRRLAGRSEGARFAGIDAGCLGRRIRPHAVRPGIRRPRSQSLRLYGVAGRGRRGAARFMARRMNMVTKPSTAKCRSMTYMRRCCGCWESTIKSSRFASVAATCG